MNNLGNFNLLGQQFLENKKANTLRGQLGRLMMQNISASPGESNRLFDSIDNKNVVMDSLADKSSEELEALLERENRVGATLGSRDFQFERPIRTIRNDQSTLANLYAKQKNKPVMQSNSPESLRSRYARFMG
jgi:hypothetical protein